MRVGELILESGTSGCHRGPKQSRRASLEYRITAAELADWRSIKPQESYLDGHSLLAANGLSAQVN